MSESPQKLRRIESEKQKIRDEKKQAELERAKREAEAEQAWRDEHLPKIEKIAERHELELDSDTRLLVEWIAKAGYVGGVEKLLNKSWVINEALRMYASQQGPTKMRALEFIADLQGLTSRGEAQKVMDVVIEGVGASRE